MPAFLLLLLAVISLPPKPDHYVTDRAGVLPNSAALNEKLADFERGTSDQILVYVDQHLPPDTTIEEMGSEAMRKWGVGQKGKDNGAILFVFVGDRKMRIEVGYGLEGSLTDAKSRWITSTVIKPEFQRGDFAAGITKGVDAMMATVRGEAYRGSATPAPLRSRNPRPGGRAIAEQVGRSSSAAMTCLAVAFVCLFIGGFIALIIWLVLRGIRTGAVTWGGSGGSGFSSDGSSSSSSDSSSSSSDSSSSFDGGGGSGGGGGASDSW